MSLSISTSFLAALVALSLHAQRISAQVITPGARSLTIEELNGLLATETKNEFA
jgi:hypothetical protein